jgi:hypothetical protein
VVFNQNDKLREEAQPGQETLTFQLACRPQTSKVNMAFRNTDHIPTTLEERGRELQV